EFAFLALQLAFSLVFLALLTVTTFDFFRLRHASRFYIIGNSCLLTRITSNVVPPKKTTSHLVETQKPELKVYNRKLKNVKNVGSSKKAKIVEYKNANHSEPNHTWGSNATDILSSSSLIMTGCPDCSLVSGLWMFETYDRERSQLMNFVSKVFGTVRFGNDHIARIMGYGDYQLGNVTISRVYYIEGHGHSLFFVGQFCDADLEVAFQKNTFFIRNLEGGDDSVLSTQEYMKQVIQDLGEDEDFNSGLWVGATEHVKVNGGIVNRC
nr:integrase, catalytic region, zinc finger, CCHC-type, peptidase aspartic, catalytic [Tanacetum cinerariifolium]